MKMTITWGITSYIHGDVLTIGILFLIICLAWGILFVIQHSIAGISLMSRLAESTIDESIISSLLDEERFLFNITWKTMNYFFLCFNDTFSIFFI